MNTPLRGGKGQTWEGGIRVPWIVRWKGHLPAGKVDDRPIIQLDVLPTALAAAGATPKPDWKLDGVNLLPYLTEKSSPPHPALYWRFGQQIALRMGDWKLVKAPGGGVTRPVEQPGKANTEGAQLYNLKEDIGEKENLAEKFPDKAKELAAVWEKWNSELAEPTWVPRGANGNAKKVAQARKKANAKQ
jgi:arylsulfatase A-like enzyme